MKRKTKRATARLILIVCLLLTGCMAAGIALDTMVAVPDITLFLGTNNTLIVRIAEKRIPTRELRKESEYRDEFAVRLEEATAVFDYERIQVEINSSGGSVRAARGVAQALAERKEYKHFVIDGECGSSMVQLLALGKPDYISMTARSVIILHEQRNLYTWNKLGNNADEIAGIMQLTGQDEATVRAWFTGSGANEWTQFKRAQARKAGFLGAKSWE